jgi:hypothetical protein
MILKRFTPIFIFVFLLASCATFKMQTLENQEFKNIETSKIAHTFFLIGDAGNSALNKKDKALSYLEEEIKNANSNSTLIFLGDNVYEKGIPKKDSKEYKLAKHRLKVQTDIGEKFSGKTIFIPGNHDWYNGLKGLKREEKLVEKALGKNSFLPENGCPLKKVEISKDINLILIDTHWFITNWNNHPGINEDCEIKTREKFFDEFEGLVKKSRGKTTLIAMHHPMFTNGPHGGFYSFKNHMKPLPILGSVKNILRKTSGIVNVDQQNKNYNLLKKRIVTISQANEKVIFISGHEHSLQYIVRDNIPQIVSGSGSKKSATKNVNGGKFSYGSEGFSRLDIYENGASIVHFFSVKEKEIVYQTNVFKADNAVGLNNFSNLDLSSKKASIYTKAETSKNSTYKFLWGKRYRKYFGTEIDAPTVNLDTLHGGLMPIRKGGGHQSKSLRLQDKNGREYVMRALRKNAVQYIQAVAFKDQYVENQFSNTASEGLLMDIFTASHPYAPFTIEKLAETVDIYHTKPVLFYVPKQEKLGEFNTDFGNELYMIEERPSDGHEDKKNFGFSSKIISTDDLRKNLAKDEKYSLDEASYIKARLFDMLIGDWDRHQDQWRWAAFKKDGTIFYKPIPRDRDQAFSIFGDGLLLNFVTKAIPGLRGMQSYTSDIKNPASFNLSGYPLDQFLIKNADKKLWDTQVKILQSQITNAIIDEAFKKFPKEVNDETINIIKKKLQGRRKNLQKISNQYFEHLNSFQIITGTNKDDLFEIERLTDFKTKITGYRIKNGKKGTVFHQKIYQKSLTKEIWVYGLDDKDRFIVKGETTKNHIKLKIIGGLGNDIFEINNPKNTKVYDHKTKKNTFLTKGISKKLTDDYETNTFNYRKLKSSQNLIAPAMWFNPDDGIKVGLKNSYTVNGFERNPFSNQHIISGFYYFATKGFELKYTGEFANVYKKWNLGIEANITSPNYARNFFGYGNNSYNLEASERVDKDYNRVKIQKTNVGSFLQWRGHLGAKFKAGAYYQSYNVQRTAGRFLETQFVPNNRIFSQQEFLNLEVNYHYKHTDNIAFSTLGLEFDTKLGHTNNINENRSFSYTSSSLAIDHRLIPNGKLVFATKVKGHFIFGNDFEFYQAAVLGAREGLRGYRRERFAGKNAFYHTSDIRWNMRQVKTNLLPINLGLYVGFDYGKVWETPNSLTVNPFSTRALNTSYGGGFFINAVDMITANLGVFKSDDGARLTVGVGFKF